MKTRFTISMLGVGLAALMVSTSAQARLLWITPAHHDCAFATSDTVRVDLMISNAGPAVGSGGCSITFDGSKLEFARAEKGNLTADWPVFNVVAGSPAVISASGGTPIPQNATGTFARLYFVDKCCALASVQNIFVCPTAQTGDLAGFPTSCGIVECVPGSPGSLSVETIYLACLGATVDTVDVDVRVEGSPQAIDAAGVDIAFNSTLLGYAGYRRGDLTQAWPFFDAVLNGNAVRVGGFTSTAVPAGTSGVFVTLRFVPTAAFSNGASSPLCTQLLVDDFAPLEPMCGAITCIPLRTQPSSWGYVKSLYR